MLKKPRGGAKVEDIQRLLNKMLQSVNVVVSLVYMCRNNDKVVSQIFLVLILLNCRAIGYLHSTLIN